MKTEIMSLPNICSNFPKDVISEITRDNFLVTLDQMMKQYDLIIIEGREGIGKTTLLKQFAQKHRIARVADIPADANLVTYIEQLLAGVVGSASARVLVSSVAKEEPIGIREVMDILDETRQAIAHSRRLEKLTVELKAANERLQELDGLKNEFISTVTHELRTPLTSIRSISEILFLSFPNLQLFVRV